ncbi:hypothetical protein [Microscilla marina]|uniref:Uncharacterized protein n=1 Tax=Microscilla marina ATCC 23134 TaxID=313606 RepID=A1ZNA7_MICM2|nr:hypothetical protein [Microscilla marina]EAY28288.1 hypothetical protein M23134_03549 [Microscilla marina ATCC 23134]
MINFNIYSHNQPNRLLIKGEGQLNSFVLEITNVLGQTIALNNLAESVDSETIYAPSAQRHHLALTFEAGALDTNHLTGAKAIGLNQSTSEKWAASAPIIDQTTGKVTLYFIAKQNEEGVMPTWTQGQTWGLYLHHINGQGGTRNTQVQLQTAHLHEEGQSQPLTFDLDQPVKIVNHRGNPYLPLHAGFGDSHTVLNDGTQGSVVLHLTNESDQPIRFHYDANEASNTSKLRIGFTAHNHQVAHALSSKAEADAMTITPPAGWEATKDNSSDSLEWVLKPDGTPQTLASKAQLPITIANIRTTHPVGLTDVSVSYENVRDAQDGHYRDGQIICQLLKQPLVHRNDKVGIGTDKPNAKLEVLGKAKVAGLEVGLRQQKIVTNNGSAGEQFGSSVAMSGNYAIVGAFRRNQPVQAPGVAYIFEKNDTKGLQQIQKISPAEGRVGDQLGTAVCLSGGYAIVGAPRDTQNGTQAGAAYIFQRDNTGVWQQQAKMLGKANVRGNFGASVGVSGNVAIVGAHFEDNERGNGAGAAYVFEQDNSSNWVQKKLLPDELKAYDTFGKAVAVWGNYAFVGATGDDTKTNTAGAVYIFERDVQGNWNKVDKLLPEGYILGHHFGASIAVSDHYLIVGAPEVTNTASSNKRTKGAAYIYAQTEAGWTQVAKLSPNDGITGGHFGINVAITNDYAVVGAPVNPETGISGSIAYVFKQEGFAWKQLSKVVAEAQTTHLSLQSFVAVQGEQMLVGADQDDANGRGATYLYDLDSARAGIGTSNPTETLEVAGNTKTHALILTAPDGNEWKVTVNNDGVLSTEPLGGFGPM